MAFITFLDFDYALNASVQIGDQVYHTTVSGKGGFLQDDSGVTTHIGEIVDIVNNANAPQLPLVQLKIESEHVQANGAPVAGVLPTINSYISFSKDKTVNDNDLLGYYASVTFQNDSKTKAELFSVGANVVESSK